MRSPDALEPLVDTPVPVLVELSTAADAVARPDVVHVELRALGQDFVLTELSDVEPVRYRATLPAAPRHLRLRLWCGTDQGPTLCGELLHTPASTSAVSLALVLTTEPTGHWQVLQRDPGLSLPLWAQVLPGLLLGLALLVHWHRSER